MTTWPLGLTLSLYSVQQAIHPINIGFGIYIYANSCFFYFFCWMVSKMLYILRQSHPVDIHRWRSFFNLMVDLIDQANKCYGPTLLFSFVFLAIWFVNGSFYILVNIRENELDRNVLLFSLVEVIAFFILFLIIYASHRICEEVSYFFI